MNKSIRCLAVSLFAFANASFAGNLKPVINDASIISYNLNTPLVTAIFHGDVSTVKKFIEYGVNVNEKSNGVTPLMYAARFNKVEIIEILILNGANINDKDNNGFTALKYAELSNAGEAVILLKSTKK